MIFHETRLPDSRVNYHTLFCAAKLGMMSQNSSAAAANDNFQILLQK